MHVFSSTERARAQVILLLYVSITVPLRAGFDVETPIWSFGMLFDMAVDVYFIVDVFLNFRTAYYNLDGASTDNPTCAHWFCR